MKLHSFVIPLLGALMFTLNACRKKDEKYEGIYIGTEHQTIHDSSATIFSLDTTYYQEFHVTYSKTKKRYSITKLNDPNESLTMVYRKDIVDHEYYPFGEIWEDEQGNTYANSAYLKFVGDSMYFISSSSVNWEYTNYQFAGRRN